MTTHCPGCPFKACPTCQYQGANVVGTQGDLWDTRGSKTAPAGNRGLTTQTVKES